MNETALPALAPSPAPASANPTATSNLEWTGSTRLTDWGVIRASGPEAAKFLHGQLTQDTEHLASGQVRLAGFCSPKGRLLASFVIWRPTPDELLLACSADVLPAALKRLQMFVMRAKCKLSDASADWPLWGVAGSAACAGAGDLAVWHCQAVATGATLLRLPDAFAEHTPGGPAVQRYLWAGGAPPAGPVLSDEAWRWLEVHSGVARVVAATVEQFVPQMVNLELVGGVNFQKGCYPGQEVVARMQYRGTLKRRAFVLTGASPMLPGQEVFAAADPAQPAGMVVLSGSRQTGQHAALVELKIAAFEADTLHAGAADGPELRAGALPYAFPSEPA